MGGGSIAQVRGFFGGIPFGTGIINAGSVSLASICSIAFGLLTSLLANLQLQATLLGQAKLNFGVVPPSIAGNLAIVAGMDANLTAALQFLPPLPSIQANLQAAVSGQIAIVTDLVAAIGLLLGFSTETVAVYAYSGPGSALGPAIAAKVTEPGNASAVLLGATSPAASAAISVFFPSAA